MDVIFIDSILSLEPSAWNSLWVDDYPFTRYEFLAALETSGSTNKKTGWQPYHALVKDGEELVAVMPLYLKYHSYGEYVFDWAWADAYDRCGLSYYPKLLNAIPFTPATGPRIGFHPHLDSRARYKALSQLYAAVESRLSEGDISSWHSLFPRKACQQYMPIDGCQRLGYQFHWFNHDFTEFEDFLATFNARKRKNLKRERRKVLDQGISIQFHSGDEVSAHQWDGFYGLYHRTYIKRSGHYGYLGERFFHTIAATMPKQVLLAAAYYRGEMIAAALYFRDQHTLYGRYWGTQEDMDGLHFETCYYQGIDYAIRHGLNRFDSGAQGEHKIQRGFTPIITASYHWLAHPSLQQGIQQFVQQEADRVKHYVEEARQYLPFKANYPLTE